MISCEEQGRFDYLTCPKGRVIDHDHVLSNPYPSPPITPGRIVGQTIDRCIVVCCKDPDISKVKFEDNFKYVHVTKSNTLMLSGFINYLDLDIHLSQYVQHVQNYPV